MFVLHHSFLALGNAVVLEPDPRTAVSGGVVIAQTLREAGLPEGLLHVLPGAPRPGRGWWRNRTCA